VNDGVFAEVIRAGGAESGVLRVGGVGHLDARDGGHLAGQTAGVSLFIDAFIEDLGLSRSVVLWFYTVATVLGSLALPLVGRLVDRYPTRLLLGLQLGLFGAMMGLCPRKYDGRGTGAAGGFGVSQGMQQALLGSAYAYYFGRAHHGTIRGLANTVFIGGTAIGPAVLALGPDFLGGFAPILWIITPIPLVLALAALVGWAVEWDAALLDRGGTGDEESEGEY